MHDSFTRVNDVYGVHGLYIVGLQLMKKEGPIKVSWQL